MAKQVDIETGIEKAVSAIARRQRAEMSNQWRDLRNKLDTLLLATNTMKTNEIRKLCNSLDQMTIEERRNHIKSHWGPNYLERSEPLLVQLQAVENHIEKQGG